MNKFISLFLIFVGFFVPVFAQSDNESIEREVRTIIGQIDNPQRGTGLEDKEFIVSLHRQILGEDPSSEELVTYINLLKKNTGLLNTQVSRSQLLAWFLAKKEKVSSLNYDILKKNLGTLRGLDLVTVPVWQPKENNHVDRQFGMSETKLPLAAHLDSYQVYFGYVHAHTSLSDGQGTPEEAYQTARDVAKLDYFSLNDHGELLLIWPWENKWNKLKETARKFNQDDKFVALHGFEWSSPVYGHLCVVNSEDLTCCVLKLTVNSLCEWVAERPNAFVRFNHPGSYDKLGVELDHLKLHASALKQMVGIEMFNGGKSVKYYFEKLGYEGKVNFFNEAQQKGWMVGAAGGQDNHTPNWGIPNFLTGVWAKSLTREGILDAYRERRTFASEDRNLVLSFKMDGAEMGSRLLPGTKKILVSLSDKDGEKFSTISIYKGPELLRTFTVDSSDPIVELSVETQPGEYYYAYVIQTDGDAAISSPIWIIN